MNDLDLSRNQINKIDEKMRLLFCERMAAVEAVAEYKRKMGLPIYDKNREASIIENNASMIENPSYAAYYTNFMSDVMKISRQYQSRILEGMKVAFSGVEGAFAHIASGKIFPTSKRIPYLNFAHAYNAVVEGECDCAVLPIENSSAGEVSAVIDLIFSGSLYINGVYELSISQNLLAKKEAELSDIKTVISHIQALEQCNPYIRSKGFSSIMCDNTALAAQQVAQSDDISVAAIASNETAEIFGLKILESNINESQLNTTRFAVLSRSNHIKEINKPDNHSIIMFSVKNEASALAKAINVIGEHKFNMLSLRSRALKDLLWKYYFYVELEGNINTVEGKNMLNDLSKFCDKLKVVGTYYNHIELK